MSLAEVEAGLVKGSYSGHSRKTYSKLNVNYRGLTPDGRFKS